MSDLTDRAATLHNGSIYKILDRNHELMERGRYLSRRFIITLALLIATASGAANAQYRSNGQVPPREQLSAMVTDTIQAYNNALQKKDFTAFHSWVSAKAQQIFSAEKMLELSRPLTDRKVNLAVLKNRTPTYLKDPEIVEQSGMSLLRVNVVYNIKETITVKLEYVTEKNLWRLLTIDVRLE